MTIFRGSRYVTAKLFMEVTPEGIGVNVLGEERQEVQPSKEDTTYIFRPGDRVDLIAYHFYGDPQLAWAILDANGIENEIAIEPGDVLRIPPLSSIPRG